MYIDNEKSKIVKKREELFNDPGYGEYDGKKYPFVLSKSELNLWDAIRDDSIKYFKENDIQWHKGKDGLPTGHLLSSQIACINHLFYLRDKQNLVSLILSNIDPNIVEAEKIDSGYIEFEFIGEHGLDEKCHKRGINCTSVDACMIGKNIEGEKIIFFIEWKYTENYGYKSIQCRGREKVYNHLIKDPKSPFNDTRVEIYYYEPFYQLMRQTLLAEQCIKYKEYGCSDYRIIHVIPKENISLLNTITSKKMTGSTIGKAWKNILKRKETYIGLSPKEFIAPIAKEEEAKSLIEYLGKRY
jgi:hypothetical protein